MKKNDQAKKIINKISQEEITPRPKWKFYAGNGFFWLLWAVLIFAGAVFGSLLFLNFFDFHPALLNFIGAGGYLMFILSNFPYFFLLFFLTFIVFGWMTIRKTKKGYRYNKFFVGAVILISVALLAGLIHAFNFDRKFEGRLAHKIPLQKNFVEKKYPGNYSVEKGFLAGEILLAGDKKLKLMSFNSRQWEVLYSERTKIHPKVMLVEGEYIITAGRKVDENVFEAYLIRNTGGRAEAGKGRLKNSNWHR